MLIFLFVISQDECEFVEVLFAEYNKQFYGIAFQILQNKESAEEAVQETFLKIINHMQKIKKLPGAEQVPYCIVIARNTSLNILRAKKRIIYTDNLTFVTDDKSPGPEQEILEMEDIELLLKMVDTLPVNDKRLLQLRYVKRLSYKQIGTLFDISEATAKKRGQRIVEKLKRKCLEGETRK